MALSSTSGWCETRLPRSQMEAGARAMEGELGRVSSLLRIQCCSGTGPGDFLGTLARVLQLEGDLASLPATHWALASGGRKQPTAHCALQFTNAFPHPV